MATRAIFNIEIGRDTSDVGQVVESGLSWQEAKRVAFQHRCRLGTGKGAVRVVKAGRAQVSKD